MRIPRNTDFTVPGGHWLLCLQHARIGEPVYFVCPDKPDVDVREGTVSIAMAEEYYWLPVDGLYTVWMVREPDIRQGTQGGSPLTLVPDPNDETDNPSPGE